MHILDNKIGDSGCSKCFGAAITSLWINKIRQSTVSRINVPLFMYTIFYEISLKATNGLKLCQHCEQQLPCVPLTVEVRGSGLYSSPDVHVLTQLSDSICLCGSVHMGFLHHWSANCALFYVMSSWGLTTLPYYLSTRYCQWIICALSLITTCINIYPSDLKWSWFLIFFPVTTMINKRAILWPLSLPFSQI